MGSKGQDLSTLPDRVADDDLKTAVEMERNPLFLSDELLQSIEILEMRKTLFLASLLAASSTALPVPAQTVPAFMTGNDLLAKCEGAPQYRFQCIGYITGVADSFEVLRALYGVGHCVPRQLVEQQLQDVVVNALRANPAQRHLAAAQLVTDAIANAWHCRR
jgi:hypothetical protein